MRVLQTQAYFDPSFVREAHRTVRDNPGVAFAWFGARDRYDDTSDVFTLFQDYSVPLGTEGRAAMVDAFLDASIRGSSFSAAAASPSPVNLEVVRTLRQTSVVIEQSPPVGLSLNALLTRAPTLAIGTYVGMQAAGELTWLMLVTVPGGILAVSSAYGIAKALENGLNQQISALFEGKPPPRLPRARPTRKRVVKRRK